MEKEAAHCNTKAFQGRGAARVGQPQSGRKKTTIAIIKRPQILITGASGRYFDLRSFRAAPAAAACTFASSSFARTEQKSTHSAKVAAARRALCSNSRFGGGGVVKVVQVVLTERFAQPLTSAQTRMEQPGGSLTGTAPNLSEARTSIAEKSE